MEKINNRTVELLIQAINNIEALDIDLPIKVFYANNKNRSRLETHVVHIQKTKLKLLKKYGVKDEKSPIGFKLENDNRTFAFKDKKSRESFESEIKPILDENIKIDLHKINIDEFKGIDVNQKSFPLLGAYLDYFVTE